MTPEELKDRKKQMDKDLTEYVIAATRDFYVETGFQVSEVNVIVVEESRLSGNTNYHIVMVETEVKTVNNERPFSGANLN